MISKDRAKEIGDYCATYGPTATKESFSLSDETLNRYLRLYRKVDDKLDDTLGKLRDKFGQDGLTALLKAKDNKESKSLIKTFEGATLKYLAIGDTHIGSKYFDPNYLEASFIEAKKQNCDFMVHTGDVLEGMSGRPGQIYELTQVGYRAQRDEAIRLFNKWGKDWYVIEGNHDCFSQDTECLTNTGWKKYDEVTPADMVYSFNPDTGKGEWQPITNLHIKTHEGDMIIVDKGAVKFSVTPNHRILYKNSKGVYAYKTAQEFYDRVVRHPTATDTFQVSAVCNDEEYDISDNMLRLISWLISDGSIRHENNPETSTPSYIIYQSKDYSAIEQLLDDMGASYHKHTRVRNITEICGKTLKAPPLPETSFRLRSITGKEVYKYLKTKGVPDWFHKLSERQFDIVARVLYHANGSSTPSDREKKGLTFGLHGTHEFLHDIQRVFATNGYATSYRKDTRGCGCLDVNKATTKVIEPKAHKEYYSGIVWCVSTPLTNLMIRYKGRTSFSGNCWGNTKHGAGITAVEDICDRVEGSNFLGYHEGDLHMNNCHIKLWHGEDAGGSYAHSYRLQKLVESFSGGEKPQVLFTGHTHKSIYIYDRNIHCVSTGCLQKQSGFMRTKRLAAHVGFWIVEMTIGLDGEVLRFSPTFYPFYK